jgi:hypothetical protein
VPAVTSRDIVAYVTSYMSRAWMTQRGYGNYYANCKVVNPGHELQRRADWMRGYDYMPDMSFGGGYHDVLYNQYNNYRMGMSGHGSDSQSTQY